MSGSPTQLANIELRNLWKSTLNNGEWPPALVSRWPMQYPPFQIGSLVFVGLNPSHRDTGPSLFDLGSPTELDDDRKGSTIVATEAEYLGGLWPARPRHAYYRPFPDLTPTGFSWAHLDVFAVRERSQSKVQQALGLPQQLTPFADSQFGIFGKLLRSLGPAAVVVVNALASRLIKTRLALGSLDNEGGYHVWDLDGRRIPVFLSGMLTGQRALDRYSRERLKWHIARTISKPPR